MSENMPTDDCRHLEESVLISIASEELVLFEDRIHANDCLFCLKRINGYKRLIGAIANYRANNTNNNTPLRSRPMGLVENAIVIASASKTPSKTPRRRWQKALRILAIATVTTAAIWIVAPLLKKESVVIPSSLAEIHIDRGDEMVRGTPLHLKDRVRVNATPVASVWVFFNDALLTDCPPGCGDKEHRVSLLIKRPGRYQFLTVITDRPPSATLDEAVTRATTNSERYELIEMEAR